jgi:hypothetical protein
MLFWSSSTGFPKLSVKVRFLGDVFFMVKNRKSKVDKTNRTVAVRRGLDTPLWGKVPRPVHLHYT